MSFATAEAVPAAAFTPNVNPNVFGTLPTATVRGLGGGAGSFFDVDFFSFSAGAGPAHFDVDQLPLQFDGTLALFDSNGTLLAWNDDTNPDPGSQSGLDSFVGVFNIPASGTCTVAISRFHNFPNQAGSPGNFRLNTHPLGGRGGIVEPNAAFGDSTYGFGTGAPGGNMPYDIHISVTPIPAPGATMLGLIGLGAVAFTRRRCG